MLDGLVVVGTGGANPTQFPAAPVTEDVVVEALSTNVASVWLGTSQGAQPFEIQPGGSVTVAPDNLQELWLRGTNLDAACYFGK